MRISGTTRVFAILGDPVQHSLSPVMYNAAFSVLGLDAVYVPIRAIPVALPHVMRGLEASGAAGNITAPHKEAAAKLVVKQTESARVLGAINTFWSDGDRLVGDNTDVHGVVRAAESVGGTGPWLVAGTGGSARAVAMAARDAGIRLHVRSRKEVRAEEFVQWARSIGTDAFPDDGSTVHTAVNATPLGLQESDPVPIPLERLAGARAAIDLVYARGETRWCRMCRSQGFDTTDGRAVLVGQGVMAFRRFFPESDPPVAVMQAAVNRALRPS